MKSICAFMLVLVFVTGYSQSSSGDSTETKTSISYELDIANSHFIIKGTSSLHDWEMVSNGFQGNIKYATTSEGVEINKISVSVGVTTLESGKRIMNKKCYDALKSDTYPNIKYNFQKINKLSATGANTYSAEFAGTLDIAGVAKNVPINVIITVKENGINIKGEKPLKMTDFQVEPPTALLGTLKTGDDIVIDFNLNYN